MSHCLNIVDNRKANTSGSILFISLSIASLVTAAIVNLIWSAYLFTILIVIVAAGFLALAYFWKYPKMDPKEIKDCIDWNLDVSCAPWWNALFNEYGSLLGKFIIAATGIAAAIAGPYVFPGQAVAIISAAIATHLPLTLQHIGYNVKLENIKTCIP